jgi:hypothetical protein
MEKIYQCKGCGAWRRPDWGYWVARAEVLPPAVEIVKTHCDTCRENPQITICMDCRAWSEYGSGIWMRATPPPEDAVASHGLCHVCRDRRETEMRDEGEG